MNTTSKTIGAGATLPGTAEAHTLVAAYPGAGTNPIPAGPFYDAVHAFKTAYNIGINDGDTSGANGDGPSSTGGYLQHNGNYDQACADAVSECLGSAPAPWADATPQQPAQPQQPPQTITTAGSSGMPTWLKWVLGLIVVGGVGALGYWAFFTPSGKRMFAGESKKKRRQRKARASARKRRAKKK